LIRIEHHHRPNFMCAINDRFSVLKKGALEKDV